MKIPTISGKEKELVEQINSMNRVAPVVVVTGKAVKNERTKKEQKQKQDEKKKKGFRSLSWHFRSWCKYIHFIFIRKFIIHITLHNNLTKT